MCWIDIKKRSLISIPSCARSPFVTGLWNSSLWIWVDPVTCLNPLGALLRAPPTWKISQVTCWKMKDHWELSRIKWTQPKPPRPTGPQTSNLRCTTAQPVVKPSCQCRHMKSYFYCLEPLSLRVILQQWLTDRKQHNFKRRRKISSYLRGGTRQMQLWSKL